MKVVDVERTVVDVPFTPRQQRITIESVSPVYNWSVLELCKVTTDTGHVGWGETVIHYTYGRVTDESVGRVLGESPAKLMNDDSHRRGLADGAFRRGGKDFGGAGLRVIRHEGEGCGANFVVVD